MLNDLFETSETKITKTSRDYADAKFGEVIIPEYFDTHYLKEESDIIVEEKTRNQCL